MDDGDKRQFVMRGNNFYICSLVEVEFDLIDNFTFNKLNFECAIKYYGIKTRLIKKSLIKILILKS